MTQEDDVRSKMLDALKAGEKLLREIVDGGCDHSVGICWCPELSVLEKMSCAIVEAEKKGTK